MTKFKKLKSKLDLNDAGILLGSTILVNAGNYLLNLLLGRILGPDVFAEVSVLATAFLLLSFIAVGFQMVAAKFAAECFATDDLESHQGFAQWFTTKIRWISLVIVAILMMSLIMIRDFLHFESAWPLFIIILGIPFYLEMSVNRGLLQGRNRFKKLAWTYLVEMASRVVVTFGVLFLTLSKNWDLASEIVAFGFLASFLGSFWISRDIAQSAQSVNHFGKKKAAISFLLIFCAYEFSQILISHSDVILVKHYFGNHEAGLYASLALLGRMVFFGTWAIVTLLFPKVIQLEKKGLPHKGLFLKSLGLVALVGVFMILNCVIFPDLIISLMYGSAYQVISPLAWRYAFATTLFALANVYAYYYLSLEKYLPVALSTTAGVAQILLVTRFHQSLESVIDVQIMTMGCLLLAMIVFQISNSADFFAGIRDRLFSITKPLAKTV
ncbi:MAG: oligosaccharide flippase family protein [Saprospiraceae bacterium]|nr:oligosaccharide flippase family protein [Saprospiraceae bacterium]